MERALLEELERELLERELRRRLQIDSRSIFPELRTARSLYVSNTDHDPFDLPEYRLSKRGSGACQLATYTGGLEVHRALLPQGPPRVTFCGVFAPSSFWRLLGFLHPGHTIHGGSVPIIRGVSDIQDTPFMVGQ